MNDAEFFAAYKAMQDAQTKLAVALDAYAKAQDELAQCQDAYTQALGQFDFAVRFYCEGRKNEEVGTPAPTRVR